MSDLDQESLFSLEVVVDRLFLNKSVICRFPAVAFRLLDFPTLLIQHVDPTLAGLIRSRFSTSPHIPVPSQLPDLLDRNRDDFAIRRGKSCLFRVSPNALLSHLSNAPLYVMVVDTFPETPKLIASSTLPLDGCAREVYEEVRVTGTSVPSVHGEQRTLDIFNLMGAKLGTVSFGVRLLSLGIAMLSHIPDGSVMHVRADKEADRNDDAANVVDSDKIIPAKSQALRAIPIPEESPRKKVLMEKSNVGLDRTFADVETEMDRRNFETIGTQTRTKRRPLSATNYQQHSCENLETLNEISPNGIVCPPPLFYNKQPVSKTRTVFFQKRTEWTSIWRSADDDDIWSDNDTIRVEDKYLDSETPNARNNEEEEYYRKYYGNGASHKDPVLLSGMTGNHKMQNFPILNALMAEIIRLQGISLVSGGGIPLHDEQKTPRFVARSEHASPKAERRKAKRMPERPLSPKAPHHCISAPPTVPKNKSWIGKKTIVIGSGIAPSLQPGMTQTQRLRLSRVNPKLLQEMEEKEADRKSRRKAAAMGGKQPEALKENVKSENAVLGLENAAFGLETSLLLDNLAASYESRESVSSQRHRRPVPTPRTSKMMVSETQERLEDNRGGDRENDFEDVATKTFTIAARKPALETRLSLRSSAEEMVELELPQFKGGREDGIVDTVAERQLKSGATRLATKSQSERETPPRKSPPSSEPVTSFGQTRSLSAPTFAAKDLPADETEDDGVLTIEGLRCIVEHYSDDDDDENVSGRNSEDRHFSDVHSFEEENEEENDRYSDDMQNFEDGNADGSDGDYSEDRSDAEKRDGKGMSRASSIGSIRTDTGHSPGHVLQTPRGGKKTGGVVSVLPWRSSKVGATATSSVEVDLERSTSQIADTYSEAFEALSDDESKDIPVQFAKDPKVLPDAKLGYTWT